MSICIGVTGGIGSGKSMVCKLIETLGYPVFYSDLEAKKAMEKDPLLKAEIISVFGEKSFLRQGINKTYLADEIFKNPIKKEKLNAIVHPAVYKRFTLWSEQQKSECVFNESALLFETGSYKRFDACILVVADIETRIERVIKRDNVTREDVLNRIENQMLDSEKLTFTTFVIENNSSDLLMPQLNTILNQIKSSPLK